MKELRAGVVGMGVMGMLHAGIINSLEDVRVVSVADTEKFVINFLKSNTPEIRVYDNYKKMLERSDLDLVYVTTPVNSHIEIASYCVQNNLHFFVEKPLSRTATDCQILCNLLRKHDVINMVGFYLRYSSTFLKARELLYNNAIGKIKKVKSTVFRTLVMKGGSGWRFNKSLSGGGVLLDLGIHAIDLLLWLFGKISSVKADAKYYYMKEIEDSVKSSMIFENGIECIFETSWNVENYRIQETTMEIEGDLGKMKVNEDYVKVEYAFPKDGKLNNIFYRQSLYKGLVFDIGGADYTREDADFINCIKTGRQSEINIFEASKVQSVVDSIYKSANTGQVEKVVYIE